MNRMIGGDGTFWVSHNIKTKEGSTVSFYYEQESGVEDVNQKIVDKYPQYFVLENETDLWVKPEADGVITLDELKDVVAMDETDALYLIDFENKQVLAGNIDWESVEENELKAA